MPISMMCTERFFYIKAMKTVFQQEGITDSAVTGFTMLRKLKGIQSRYTAIGMIGYLQKLDTQHMNTSAILIHQD